MKVLTATLLRHPLRRYLATTATARRSKDVANP